MMAQSTLSDFDSPNHQNINNIAINS